MNIIISNSGTNEREELFQCGGFLDMQIGMELLVIDWAKEEPKMGQIIRHIYVYWFNFQFLSRSCNIFSARSIALKEYYLTMNFEKN